MIFYAIFRNFYKNKYFHRRPRTYVIKIFMDFHVFRVFQKMTKFSHFFKNMKLSKIFTPV